MEGVMTNLASVLNQLTEQSTGDDLKAVAYVLGECLARRDDASLREGYDRLRALRRNAADASSLRGFLIALTTSLDGYFATIEAVTRVESLADEVKEMPTWQTILARLAAGPVNQVELGHAQAEPRAKSTISIALEDLRQRELVEHVPSASRRERIHSLTRLGRAVVEAAQLEVSPAVAVSAATSAPAPTAAVASGPKGRRPTGRKRNDSGEQTAP
ncbi:MAG: hypothetical protein IPL61_25760 [Myxococcales bacterium]|nr:hypothetical protein [Myxococcales bacterium]